jgi:Flp pilus assembly protein TadG
MTAPLPRARRRPPRGGGLAAIWRDRTGAQAVEFALVLPTLLLLIFGSMEIARLLWTQAALHLSVEEAARCGAVSLCTTSTAPATAAAVVPQLNFPTSTFTAISTTCGFKVTASFSFQFIARGLLPYSPTLTALACFA